VTLEGIDGVEAFVEMLDRIEPPGQLVSFLTDPLLQKFVELKPSPIVSARIGLWLATCLEDLASAAVRGTEDTALLAELLNALLQHARYTKVCIVSRASHNADISADYITYYTGIPERICFGVEWSRQC
jgi:centromere protein I